MSFSWAAVAAAPPPPPTPMQRMQEICEFYVNQPDGSVLLDCLGLQELPGTTDRIAPLIDHAVVVGIDTEAWTKNTDEMTEIGLAIFKRQDMLNINQRNYDCEKQLVQVESEYEHLGDFGESLLKQISFHHLRIVETAHLKTNAEWMKGAEGNRFGYSRFVTFAEARDVLDSVLCQPIDSPDPSLAGCKRPIILVGHAIYHDAENLKKNGLTYDWSKHGTIVKEIDTQPLAKATRTWIDLDAPNNDVSLEKLTKKLGFTHDDAHTACNDAARTLICAIHMVLPNACKENKTKNMQAVARIIEQHSRDTFISAWGSEFCCTRCGGRDHEDKEGARCQVPVHCMACARYDAGSEKHWKTHIDMFCLHVAEYKAWVRRRDDAIRKRNPVPPGPPLGSHPAFDAIVPLYARNDVQGSAYAMPSDVSDSVSLNEARPNAGSHFTPQVRGTAFQPSVWRNGASRSSRKGRGGRSRNVSGRNWRYSEK